MLSVISDTDLFLPLGTCLGNYEIKAVIGQGGFGITYWAIDAHLGREVVLKEHYPFGLCKRNHLMELEPGSFDQTSAYNRSLDSFCREARLLAAIEHQGVVRIYDVFQALGTAYIVMPFVEGAPFDQWLEINHCEYEKVLHLLLSLLMILRYLHAQNILHRDIKPSNIIVKDDGEPVLLDFGSALEGLPLNTITVVASPLFSPPEQYLEHGKIGAWSDLFALGRSFISVLGDTLDIQPKLLKESLITATKLEISERFQSAQEWLDYFKRSTRRNFLLYSLWSVCFCAPIAVGMFIFLRGERHQEIVPTISQTPPQKMQGSLVQTLNDPKQTYIPYQKDNPHPIPDAPDSLEGHELLLSSRHLMFLQLSFRGESPYGVAQQLMHYQKLDNWEKADKSFESMNFRFIDRVTCELGDGEVCQYVYKKLSKDKGVIIIRPDDGLEDDLYILLHFSSPDSGMSLYTGEERIYGNLMFMLTEDLSVNQYHKSRKSQKIDQSLQTILDKTKHSSSRYLNSVVAAMVEFDTSHVQYAKVIGKQDLSPSAQQDFAKNLLMNMPTSLPWDDVGITPLSGDVFFPSRYSYDYQGKTAYYIYNMVSDSQCMLELHDFDGVEKNMYILMKFSEDEAGVATLYDGKNTLIRNIKFKIVTPEETNSDRGVMPETYFKRAMKNQSF